LKPRLKVIFLLVLIAPLATLAWLGAKVIRDESEMVRHRFDRLAEQELAGVNAEVMEVVDRWRRDLERAATLDAGTGTDEIRRLVRKERTVRQVFVLDPDGKRVHPPPDAPRNRSEEDFLVRTRQIWESSEPFSLPTDATPGRDSASGWYTWHWGRGLHLIFWRKDPSGRVAGAEADRMALISDIVGELPDTDPNDPGVHTGRIRIVDANGDVVYGWGLGDPREDERPRVVRALDAPFGSWGLEYFPAKGAMDADIRGGLAFGMATGFGALLLVVMGLAVYFLREGGREIREARDRVTFVNQVSHELKTPLTNIRMYAELLADRLDEDEDGTSTGYVGVIVSESRRLSRLIGNVLSFARKGRGKLAVHPAPGLVDDTLAEVVDQFRPGLESKGVAIDFRPGAPGQVGFDADALGQILGNLLGNVEKYAASGKKVEVMSRREGDRTVIDVTDYGPGVPESMREKVFRPFYRISSKVADGVTGTGIGLSISRDLARLHGGDLTLEPGDAGARFRVILHTPEVRDHAHRATHGEDDESPDCRR